MGITVVDPAAGGLPDYPLIVCWKDEMLLFCSRKAKISSCFTLSCILTTMD